MRFSFHFVLICLALLVCLQSAGAAPHAALRRQDDNTTEDVPASTTQESAARQSSGTPTLEPKSTPTPTPSNQASSRAESDRPSFTVASSTKPSESASIPTEVPSTDSSNDPAPSSSPSKFHDEISQARKLTVESSQWKQPTPNPSEAHSGHGNHRSHLTTHWLSIWHYRNQEEDVSMEHRRTDTN